MFQIFKWPANISISKFKTFVLGIFVCSLSAFVFAYSPNQTNTTVQNQLSHNSMLDEFIQKMPKAELHLHIEGTLEPEFMFKLAKRNNIKLPYSSVDEVRQAYQFTDLQSFLNAYDLGMRVLKTEQDFYELTWEYLKKAHAQNIIHTEIFFDPQAHLENGIAFSTMVNGISKALIDARNKLGISSNLIMSFLRDRSAEDAERVLEMALEYKYIITAVGLDSAEVNNPPEKFKAVFDRARANGFKTVAHAGEEGPPAYVVQALDLLKVSRIDHGIRSVENKKLTARLVAEKIPLTVCPLSNVKLKVFQTMREHPIKKMLKRGLFVTVNSDDPAYFDGYLNKNYISINHALGLSYEEAYILARNSFEASFIDEDIKNKYLRQLDAYYNTYRNK